MKVKRAVQTGIFNDLSVFGMVPAINWYGRWMFTSVIAQHDSGTRLRFLYAGKVSMSSDKVVVRITQCTEHRKVLQGLQDIGCPSITIFSSWNLQVLLWFLVTQWVENAVETFFENYKCELNWLENLIILHLSSNHTRSKRPYIFTFL